MASPEAGSHVDLGRGCHAWLAASGGWGNSNAGLVVGGGESLLVDTLFDVVSTSRMLASLRDVVATARIERVVNTHGNGDHWFGNQLLADREIITAAPTAVEMKAVGPAELRGLMAQEGRAGDVARHFFRWLDLSDVEPAYPTTLYEDELDLVVGGTDVRLIDVGPAHTAGDTIVHVPSAGVVYTGDIVFAGGTPIVWSGPIGNWLRACDLICELGVSTVVPGHGPVTTTRAVQAQASYLRFVQEEAAARYEKGMTFAEAAKDVDLGEYGDLPERERLVVNVHAVYRELDPGTPALAGPAAFACMGEFLEDLA